MPHTNAHRIARALRLPSQRGDVELPNRSGRVDPRLTRGRDERSLNPMKDLGLRVKTLRRRSLGGGSR